MQPRPSGQLLTRAIWRKLEWLLQGVNILPGSFMTGQPFWAGAGIVLIIAGMSLMVLAMRRKAEHD